MWKQELELALATRFPAAEISLMLGARRGVSVQAGPLHVCGLRGQQGAAEGHFAGWISGSAQRGILTRRRALSFSRVLCEAPVAGGAVFWKAGDWVLEGSVPPREHASRWCQALDPGVTPQAPALLWTSGSSPGACCL